MTHQSKHLYEFGRFRLDIAERLFLKDGSPVSVTPKAFEILRVLVQRSGHLVEKEELLKEVWADIFVEESNLTRNIYLLRKALGKGTNGQPYIETVPRKGYRFVANVRVVPIPDDQSFSIDEQPRIASEHKVVHEVPALIVPNGNLPTISNNSRSRSVFGYRLLISILIVAAASVLLYVFGVTRTKTANTAVGLKSLAVLPFKSIDNQSGDEPLGLGMANAVIVNLSRLPDVSVLPTTSVFRYTERAHDPMAAGRELGVDAVLDGTVQRSDNHIRVTVQLINVGTGRTLWSKKFDQPNSGIFALQDSVSEQVAQTLAPQISGEEKRQLVKRLTESTDAYQAYLMGLYFWNKRNKESTAKAILYLQQAIEKDPKFARAYAVLADCYFANNHLGYKLLPAEEAWQKTRAATEKALELDETVAEAHTVMAYIKAVDKDFVGAEKEHKRAIELDPNFAIGHLRYGLDLFNRLHLAEAIDEIKRAHELDPLSPTINAALSFIFAVSRNYDGVIKHSRRALELDPERTVARLNLAEAYASKGMFSEAIALFDGLPGELTLIDQQYLAFVYAKAGRRRETRSILARLQRSLDREPDLLNTDRDMTYNFAVIYLALGEKEKAFEWLERVGWDRFRTAKLNFDPQLDALRSDSRFASFVRRHNIVLSVPPTE